MIPKQETELLNKTDEYFKLGGRLDFILDDIERRIKARKEMNNRKEFKWELKTKQRFKNDL